MATAGSPTPSWPRAAGPSSSERRARQSATRRPAIASASSIRCWRSCATRYDRSASRSGSRQSSLIRRARRCSTKSATARIRRCSSSDCCARRASAPSWPSCAPTAPMSTSDCPGSSASTTPSSTCRARSRSGSTPPTRGAASASCRRAARGGWRSSSTTARAPWCVRRWRRSPSTAAPRRATSCWRNRGRRRGSWTSAS